MVKIVRVYSEASIELFQPISLPMSSVHYLINVMRRKKGDKVIIFDGKAGEFEAILKILSKKKAIVEPVKKLSNLQKPRDIWIAFTPLKKDRTDFLIEKCTEIGTQRIIPLITDYATNRKPRIEKMKLLSIEAVEQCGGNFLPEISKSRSLNSFIGEFPSDRYLIFCDEATRGPTISKVLKNEKLGRACLLIGPEGGFSPIERQMILAQKNVFSVSLGNRILRAETAAVFALAIWHSSFMA